MLRKILFLFALAYLVTAAPASALTFEQVLALRKAGLSDKTIQMMIEQENRNPFDTESPNTWTASDGREFRSTGQGRRPADCSDSSYPIYVSPTVVPVFPRLK